MSIIVFFSGGVEALAYTKLPSTLDPNPSIPDMELIFIGGSLSTDLGAVFRRMFNFPLETYEQFWRPLEGLPVCQVSRLILRT